MLQLATKEVIRSYSTYVNNFTAAISVLEQGLKKKVKFISFLKEKYKQSNTSLSLQGLLLKPIQRFPQYILFIQVNIIIGVQYITSLAWQNVSVQMHRHTRMWELVLKYHFCLIVYLQVFNFLIYLISLTTHCKDASITHVHPLPTYTTGPPQIHFTQPSRSDHSTDVPRQI